jgi:biotin carboxyl carrier protein
VLEAAERFAARELGVNPWRGRFRPGVHRPAPTDPVVRGPDGALHVWQDGRSWRVERARLADADALAHAPAAAGAEEHARVTAPMPGTVLRVHVREGDEVAAHETLLILEAMKMEHPLTAPFDARVARVNVAEGGGVQAGDALIELLAR